MINWLSVLGLLIDIAGAFYLARAMIFNPGRRIASVSAGFFGPNPFTTASLIEQKFDSTAGLTLLVSGFLLQLLAVLGLTQELVALCFGVAPPVAITFGVALLFGVGVLWYEAVRKEMIVRKTMAAVQHPENKKLRKLLYFYLRNVGWTDEMASGWDQE